MTIRPVEIGITLVLAFGFVAVGETCLGRRSRELVAWTESFLVGIGVCAALLFPVGLLFRRNGLHTLLGLMGIAVLVAAGRRLAAGSKRPATTPAIDRRSARVDPIALALLVAILVVGTAFAALTLRYSYLWDGFQIWATKAQLLFTQGSLGRQWFPEDTYDSRLLGYPAAIPMFEALLCVVRGKFDFDVLKPVFLPFYAALLLATYGAARAVVSRRLALAATLLLALLPGVSTRGSAAGYADMPQAAFVAGVAAASLRGHSGARGWRHPLPWLIGSLTTVKSEGILLAGIGSSAVLLFWLLENPRRIQARLRSEWSGALVVLAFVGLRLGYARWLGLHDTTYGPLDAAHLRRVPDLLGRLAKLCVEVGLDPQAWGLFWGAFLLAFVVIAAAGSRREVSFALAPVAGVVVYATIFLFTNWVLSVQVAQAYPRLLTQLAPAAAVTIVLGYERARSSLADRLQGA